jgi:hypothetical protein
VQVENLADLKEAYEEFQAKGQPFQHVPLSC